MSIKQQKPYSSEFKESAIKLALEGEKPIAHTAKNLGIKKSTLYTWINKHVGPKALVEKSNNNEHVYDENKRLRKELARVIQERDLLKKAAAYFAKETQ
jgi:transposase